MRERFGFLMDGTAGSGAVAPAVPAAPAPGPANSGGADGPSAPAAISAPSAPAPAPGGLLARGAAAPASGPSAAPTPAGDSAVPSVPEKYIVKKEDGTTDWEATALKQAGGYQALSQRLGAGDAPPKTPDEYAPAVTAGLSLDALKADPKYQAFLKGAHARGMTNAQLGYVLDHYAMAMQPDPAAAEAELRKDWATDDQLQRGLEQAYRASAAYAGSEEVRARLEQKFGNDPDFIRLMARIGNELQEDRPPAGITQAESDTLESLMKSPAYFDAKHPDHAVTVRKAQALYAKKYPSG